MSENAKIDEAIRAIFQLPGDRLTLFFTWGLFQPLNPLGWENFLQWQRRALDIEKTREEARKSYWKNPEARKARMRDYKKETREYHSLTKKIWISENLEKKRQTDRAYRKNRLAGDVQFRLCTNLRIRMTHALQGKGKSAASRDLLGMPLSEYRIYLQGQFQPGMTWENYGEVWEVDHIRPCAAFDLSNPMQQQDCFNWSNTQPLFCKENRQKGARV